MTALPSPEPGRRAAEAYVSEHFKHLVCDDVNGSDSFVGGQEAADKALAAFDVKGYAQRRNEVFPIPKRGASLLSPYIRHGLLHLADVWDAVSEGPGRDVDKFRDELMWQEFARHWYARLGHRTRHGVRNEIAVAVGGDGDREVGLEGWNRDLACLELTVDELEEEGWLVNQTRMWLASHWAVRQQRPWQDGEDVFFRHLLDGSRAANRLGWQWTTGVGSSKAYGFSRWQVEKRAPGLCASCDLVHACPVEDWPSDPSTERLDALALLKSDPNLERTAGPDAPHHISPPDAVWITAESLGDHDPALAANPELPVVFVFDEPLLERLMLSSKRLVFLTETLAGLATTRQLEIYRGEPTAELAGRSVATTFAPVPGFARRAEAIQPAELHPWPWMVRPTSGSIASYSAWRRSVRV